MTQAHAEGLLQVDHHSHIFKWQQVCSYAVNGAKTNQFVVCLTHYTYIIFSECLETSQS